MYIPATLESRETDVEPREEQEVELTKWLPLTLINTPERSRTNTGCKESNPRLGIEGKNLPLEAGSQFSFQDKLRAGTAWVRCR
mmetsp:Transcript_36905/g.147346  ORF Transcript_36905/g.147346 Transcript_36905/m.147346 type:complete len:84 (-) Transcript_36905:2240-2491(-)